MELKRKNLEKWLQNPPKMSMKAGESTEFYSKYQAFKQYIDKFHGEVERGALLSELKEKLSSGEPVAFDEITLLNDHGPKHIETVIERVTQLLNTKSINLNVREVFLLVNAIQLHDVGNFYGRLGHESKIKDIFKDGLPLVAFDTTENIYIQNIARVHGGSVLRNGVASKNTIGGIKEIVVSDGYEIRMRLLASLLRFADELADDRHRASRYLLFDKKLPKASEIYHAYSFCLDTVLIKHQDKAVELHFKIPEDLAINQLGKNVDQSRYLVDEIYDRVVKMHREKIYCSKFWKTHLDIEKIWVQIEFYHRTEPGDFVHDDITFTIMDNEYPSSDGLDIYSLCPNLVVQGAQLDGLKVDQNIRNQKENAAP